MSAMEQFKEKDIDNKPSIGVNEVVHAEESEGVVDKSFKGIEKLKKMSPQMMAVVGAATILFGGFMYVKVVGGGSGQGRQQSAQSFNESQSAEPEQNQISNYQPSIPSQPSIPQLRDNLRDPRNASLAGTEPRTSDQLDQSMPIEKPSQVLRNDTNKLAEVPVELRNKDKSIIEALEKKVAQLESELAAVKSENKQRLVSENSRQTKQSAPSITPNNHVHTVSSGVTHSRKQQNANRIPKNNGDFDPGDQGPKVVTDKPVEPTKYESAKLNSGLSLYAIKDGRAWIKTAGGDIVFISAGDIISGGAKVKSIESDRVVTTNGIIE